MKVGTIGFVFGLLGLLPLSILTQASAGAGTVELIASLDLSRPDLSRVKAAVDKEDFLGAAHAFADHLRARRGIRWRFDPATPPGTLSAAEKEEADNAVNHTFTVVNLTHTFAQGGEIDWKFNPTALPDSKHALNHEWTWQFNRMYFWPALAHAYRATGERKYADELTKEIVSWIRANPVPTKAENVPNSRWRTIEAGIRMFNGWPEVFFTLLSDREAFPDDAMLAMVDSMREHAEYLDNFPTAGNWKTMESNGLFHVAALFPEFKAAGKWREDAIRRQHEELSIQIYPDGPQKELAPGYHNVALKQFLGTLDLARLNNIPLPPDYAQSLEKMFDVNLYLCLPDRTFANFNDSGRGDAAAMLAEGLRIFPKRQDWRWIVTEGREGKPPAKTGFIFPDAGWMVMRSSWKRDAVCLIMDAGPYGTSHAHEDKLSFILDAYGSRLVAEAGIFTYDASAMRKYSLGPAAHNTVFIDGLGENRRAGPASVMHADPSLPLTWISNNDFDFAEATFGHHEGERWGKDRLIGFIHTRRILFVKPTYFVVVDTITPPAGDTAEHTCEAVFHLDAAEAAIDRGTYAVTTADPERAKLTILPLKTDGLSVRLVKGQTEPGMQGWISDHTFDQRPVPTAIFTKKSAGPVHLLYVFAPAAAGQPFPLVSVTPGAPPDASAVSAVITLRDGGADNLLLLKDGSLRLTRSNRHAFSSAKP
jgi:hypothetical protein